MSDKKIKVSVIIPVYNAQKYLEKSLLFLCRQTLDDIEFILADDASKDNSVEIMKTFKMAFPDKFTLISMNKNKGPGAARNAALKYAKGEYIAFSDSDDYPNEKMYELLYNKAKEENSDLVLCAYRNQETGDDVFIDTDAFNNGLTPQSRNVLMAYTGFLMPALFKRSVMEKMNFYFSEEYVYEDICFLAEFYCRAESISFVPQSLYLHTYNEGSVSNVSRPLEDYISLVKRNVPCIKEKCLNTPFYEDVKQSLEAVYMKIIKSWAMALAAYDVADKEHISELNAFLMKYAPNYKSNKYISNSMQDYDLIKLFDDNDEIFISNLTKYRKKRIADMKN